MSQPVHRSERLHPEALAVLEALDAQNAPPLASLSPAEARIGAAKRFKQFGGELEALDRVEDRSIPGPDGNVPVRIYARERGGLRPAMIYFHGGGFVFGDLDTHEPICRSLAKESGAVVIAVGYRLSPEHKFPAALEDAHCATRWIATNAEQLGIDAGRICITGDSAGGNLATVIARRCRDAGGPALGSQVMIYPVIDLSSFETESYREFAEGHFLGRGEMQWFAGHYLASASEGRNPEASPLLDPDLSGLPPALVITAEFDPLRDEGEAYAKRLREAGTPVTLTRYPGVIHGFVVMRGAFAAGREAIMQIANFVKSIAAV
jgi:acetyl esterase